MAEKDTTDPSTSSSDISTKKNLARVISSARDSVRRSEKKIIVQDKYARPRARSLSLLPKSFKRSKKGPYAGGPGRARSMFPSLMKSDLNPDVAPVQEEMPQAGAPVTLIL